MSLSTCTKCGGHIPLGPDATNRCEDCGTFVFPGFPRSESIPPPMSEQCDHGILARSCEVCAEWKPRAMEAEARVVELEARCLNDDLTLDLNQRAIEAIQRLPGERLDDACSRVVAERDRYRAALVEIVEGYRFGRFPNAIKIAEQALNKK